jgi:hypothetical protein
LRPNKTDIDYWAHVMVSKFSSARAQPASSRAAMHSLIKFTTSSPLWHDAGAGAGAALIKNGGTSARNYWR